MCAKTAWTCEVFRMEFFQSRGLKRVAWIFSPSRGIAAGRPRLPFPKEELKSIVPEKCARFSIPPGESHALQSGNGALRSKAVKSDFAGFVVDHKQQSFQGRVVSLHRINSCVTAFDVVRRAPSQLPGSVVD